MRGIREVYQTLNRCDNNWLTTTRDVYYKTNRTPSIVVGPIGGGGSGSGGTSGGGGSGSGGSGSGGTGGGSTPPGYDPSCQMLPDQQCTIASIIENYGGEDSKTKVGADGSGCRSLTYTSTC